VYYVHGELCVVFCWKGVWRIWVRDFGVAATHGPRKCVMRGRLGIRYSDDAFGDYIGALLGVYLSTCASSVWTYVVAS